MIRYALLAALLSPLLGCGEDITTTTLGGSASRIHSLNYSAVRARLTQSEFAIQYLDGGETPVQIVIDLALVDLDGPTTLDIAATGDVIGVREMSRLPALVSGTLTLTEFTPAEGARVAGEFDAQVGSTDRSYAVFGTFDTQLEVLGAP